MGIEQQHPIGGSPRFKDFGYYVKWWLVWGSIAGILSPVYGVADAQFWIAKGIQLATGAAAGFACAIIFTFAQNTYNSKRVKAVSWINAIAIWTLVKFALFYTFTR